MPTFTVVNDASFSRQIVLTPEDEKHLRKALRARPGDILQITNGEGRLARVKVASLEPLKFDVIDVHDGEKPLPITVHLPLIDQDRLEWAVEKLTELNAAKIQLIATERTQARELKPAKFERLKKSAVAAQKQSGRAFPVIIGETADLRKIALRSDTLKLIASFGGKVPSENARDVLAKAPWLDVFIGPEGGFTQDEEAFLFSGNFLDCYLGGTVLRAETAAITLMALVRTARW